MCAFSVLQIGICSVEVLFVNVWHMATLNMWLISNVFTYTATLVLVRSGEAASIHASNKSWRVLETLKLHPLPSIQMEIVE